MGWDNPELRQPVDVLDSALRPVPVADKRGVTAWRVDCPNGLPKRSEQHRVVRCLKRLSRDQLVVFVAPDRHLWQWPEQRQSGVGYRLVDHEYPANEPTEALLQRLEQASFKIEEEAALTSSSVLTRVRRSFNADKVTKSFYREFQKHHKGFADKIEGVATSENQRWYASVLLNRLMFIYFIQRKEFLDGNQNYLRARLGIVREHYGADQFYAFYKQFLLPLFHEGLGSSDPSYDDPEIESIIGSVPYVNGGIFEPHELEQTYDIQIPDEAFETLFDFFDAWRWHLDETPSGDPREINPDILGYIFEQYINFTEKGQKEKGAYYTKPDVTGLHGRLHDSAGAWGPVRFCGSGRSRDPAHRFRRRLHSRQHPARSRRNVARHPSGGGGGAIERHPRGLQMTWPCLVRDGARSPTVAIGARAFASC